MRLFDRKSPEKKFWDWFSENRENFTSHDSSVLKPLAEKIHSIHPDLTFEFSLPKGGEREFVISADGIRGTIPAVEKLCAAAPDIVGWTIKKYRQRGQSDDIELQFGEIKFDSSDFYVTLHRDGSSVGLTVFVRDTNRFSKEGQYQGAAWIFLDNAIGEYDMMTKVGFVEFADGSVESELPKYALRDLPQAFDEFFEGMNR